MITPDSFGQGMTLIVKTITRLTVGLILLLGIYIVLEGHSSPGGGFAGGVIIALGFVHLVLAFGKESVHWHMGRSARSLIRSLDAPRIMALSMIGFAALWCAHSMMAHRGYDVRPYDVLVMDLCHLFIALNVGAGLFVVFVKLVGFKVETKGRQ